MKAAPTAAANKRGRPEKAKNEENDEDENEEDVEPPKKRGHPAKARVEEPADEPPKKRGRPARAAAEDADEDAVGPPKKKGRPAKAKAATEEPVAEAPKRGRGRPKKDAVAPAVPEEEEGPPFTRHEAPLGGETTVAGEDGEAAAEQLEDELLDTTEEIGNAVNSKRKAPIAKMGKAKGKAANKALTNGADDEAIDAAVASAKPFAKSFWLMKAEQEDRLEPTKSGQVINTKFTIDDLRSKTVPEPWDGKIHLPKARSSGLMISCRCTQRGCGEEHARDEDRR